jgi:hypothetical protein
LKAAVSVPFALSEKRLDEGDSRLGGCKKFVQVSLDSSSDDRHHRHMVLPSDLQHLRIRSTPHESVAVNAIPGGHENVDFVSMFGE